MAKKKIPDGKRPPASTARSRVPRVDNDGSVVATKLRTTQSKPRVPARRVRAPAANGVPLESKSVSSTAIPPPPPTPSLPPPVEPAPIPCAFIDRGLPIPGHYGFDRLVALVRDPAWIFCYWELDNGRMPDVRERRGQGFIDACAWVLRIYRLNESAADDLEIDPSLGNWYFHVGCPGRYQVELALLSPDGEWISLLLSRIIETPLNGPSDIIDDEWRLRPEDEDALLRLLRGPAEDAAGRGTSGLVGASRFLSSFSVAGSMGMLGSSASGRPVAGSWAFSFQGASGVGSPGGSSGSGGFGWMTAPNGAQEPILERPTHNSGPNWNAQPELPATGLRRTAQPHFRIKLPRRLERVEPPELPAWPPVDPPKKGLRRRK